MRTTLAKKGEVDRKWYVVDLDGQVLGRAASQIASILRGKNKPIYTPHVDTGDFVIVLNAEKVVLTGRKWSQKTYYRHSGYVGGIRSETAEKLRDRAPTEIIMRAVKGMLPNTRLGRQQLKKLKVYAGTEHPHTAQNPEPLSL